MKNYLKNRLSFTLALAMAILLINIPLTKAHASTKASVPSNYTGTYSINEEYESKLTVTWDKEPGAQKYEVYCRSSNPDAELKWGSWYKIQDSEETMASAGIIDGYLQIKVRVYNGSTYSDFTPAITILGGEGIVTVIKEEMNVNSKTLYVGSSYTLKLLNAENTIKWSTSKKTIAKVSSNGEVTGVSKGTATITATTNGKKYTCKITVKQQSSSTLFKNILKEGKYTYKTQTGTSVSFPIKSYLYLDFDQNGTKELLISNYDLYDVYQSGCDGIILSYKNGKIIASDVLYDILVYHKNELKVSYNKKYKGILSTYHPFMGMRGYEANIYVYSKGKVSSKYECGFINMDTEEEFYAYVDYYIGKNTVSKSKYDAYLKKYYNKKDCKYYSLKLNTY